MNIKKYIERIYNKVRLHSGIGYLSPEEFETEDLNKNIR
jgi:transposase InsO family protein